MWDNKIQLRIVFIEQALKTPTKGRRRGNELEEAILAAAWEELSTKGYADFTLEGVAKRAQTSRPVLSRRWGNRAEIAVAALKHYLQRHPVKVPNSGKVRDDLVALLQNSSRRSCSVNGILFSMKDYFAETGTSMSELRNRIAGDHTNNDAVNVILQRGFEHGEIDPDKVTPRISALPMDLVRHETLMTDRPISLKTAKEIVETIFLPLVRRGSEHRND